MAMGIFEQLAWLTKKVNQLCCIVKNGGGGGECVCETIEKTKSQIDSLISSNGLLPGRTYRISNVCPPLYGGTDVILQAATTNTLVNDGEGFFYNPKYDTYPIWNNVMPCTVGSCGFFQIFESVTTNNGATGYFVSYGLIAWNSGDWSTATTVYGSSSGTSCSITGAVTPQYAIGDKVIYGGKVWENINGNLGSTVDTFNLDSAEWDLVAYNTSDYNLVVDEIKYDYDLDTIYYRRDGNDTTSNIVDGDYYSSISYEGVKGFQWGNINVNGNTVSNSRCEIINQSGNFIFNTITQGTAINYIYCDSGCSIEYNTLTDAYLAYLFVSQESNISYNTLLQGALYATRLSNMSSISENNISYSYINDNFLDGSSAIDDNYLNNGCGINNTYVLNDSGISYNILINESNMYANKFFDNNAVTYNKLESNSRIYNMYQSGDNTAENYIQFNTLLNSSDIHDCSNVYIAFNNLSNSSEISACGPSGGDSLSIVSNILNNSDIYYALVTTGSGNINNNSLTATSSIYGIEINNNIISNNTFVNSNFTNCTMDLDSAFRNNDFYNSGLSSLIDWGDGYNIESCRLNNSTIDGTPLSGIGSLYNGSIINATMTDVTLNQDLGGATYIFEQYSKTISLCPDGSGGYVPRISFIYAPTGTLIVDDYNA
jgi:hypothetical protein